MVFYTIYPTFDNLNVLYWKLYCKIQPYKLKIIYNFTLNLNYKNQELTCLQN